MNQVKIPPDLSTEQVKVASSPGQTHCLSGETDPPAAEPVSDPDLHKKKMNDNLHFYMSYLLLSIRI